MKAVNYKKRQKHVFYKQFSFYEEKLFKNGIIEWEEHILKVTIKYKTSTGFSVPHL